MTLDMTKAGDRVAILRIKGGGGFMHRLAGMGILPGRELKVVRNWGPLIVQLHRERFVVGRGMADRIEVETVAHPARSIPRTRGGAAREGQS